MSENTAGFYKHEQPSLHHAPNYVLDNHFSLYKETKDDNAYPIDGWYWFDSIEEARAFYGIPTPPVEEIEI